MLALPCIHSELCLYLCSQVGSSLSVLIGICLIGFMVYNVLILVMSKLFEWRGKIARVFFVDGDGNVEEQAAEDGVNREGTRNEI